MDYRSWNSTSSTSNSQACSFFRFKFKSVTNIIVINQKSVTVIPFSLAPTFSSLCLPLLPNWSPSPLMLLYYLISEESPLFHISISYLMWALPSSHQDFVFPLHCWGTFLKYSWMGSPAPLSPPNCGKAHPLVPCGHQGKSPPTELSSLSPDTFPSLPLFSDCFSGQPTYFHTSVPLAQDTSNLLCLENSFSSFRTQLKCPLFSGTSPAFSPSCTAIFNHSAPRHLTAQTNPHPVSDQS